MYICSLCYYSGSPNEDEKSDSGGLSGFIGSIFGSGNKTLTCPKCEKKSNDLFKYRSGKRNTRFYYWVIALKSFNYTASISVSDAW